MKSLGHLWRRRPQNAQQRKEEVRRVCRVLQFLLLSEKYFLTYQRLTEIAQDEEELDGYTDASGNTILHVAAMRRSFFIPILLSRGCRPKAVNAELYTPLHFAAGSITKAYINLDQLRPQQLVPVPPNDLEELRLRALAGAISPWDSIRQLLLAGSDPNARTSDGQTPLLFALRADVPVVQLAVLMSFGANPANRDAAGRSVYDWARILMMYEALNYLQSLMNMCLLVEANRFGASSDKKRGRFPITRDLLRQLLEFLR